MKDIADLINNVQAGLDVAQEQLNTLKAFFKMEAAEETKEKPQKVITRRRRGGWTDKARGKIEGNGPGDEWEVKYNEDERSGGEFQKDLHNAAQRFKWWKPNRFHVSRNGPGSVICNIDKE